LKIKMDTWFKLPYVGSDVFRGLRASGVDYEKGMGFRFTSSTNLERATAIISEAIREPVEIESEAVVKGKGRKCFICGEPKVEEESDGTVCDDCMKGEDAYSLYVLKFSDLMNEV